MNPDRQHLYFIIPDPEHFYSGGNIYNAALIRALKAMGQACSLLEPQEPSTIIFREQDYFFWDTLFLNKLASLNPEANNWLIVHHLESLYPPKGFSSIQWFEQNERHLLERFDGFLVSSYFTADYLKKMGLIEQKIIVVEPALDHKPEIPERQIETVNALIIANLQERKGILPFLEVLKEKHLPKGLHITIAGSDKFEPAYAAKCKVLIDGAPKFKKHVQYPGSINPEGVWQLYYRSNLFISTAFMETYGMAIQEAAATGLPLLVLNGGNAGKHVVEGKNGIVCQDLDYLVEQLFKITQNQILHKSLTTHAVQKALANDYTWGAAAKRLVEELVGFQS